MATVELRLMSGDLCPHGDIEAACLDCLHERPAGPAEKPEPVEVVGVFAARYPGHCNACNLAIHEGQMIARFSNNTYEHAGCVR